MTCKDCIHRELCADYVSSLAKIQNADVKYISQWLDEIEGKKNQTDNECEHFADRSRFVELPFEPNKGASSFDKVAHITYTFATEAHPLVRHTVEDYYVMYNEERLYTLEKDGIVILAHGSSPHDTVEKAKHAIEGLSKEREANANDLPQSDNHS